jgi:hypothetical protein
VIAYLRGRIGKYAGECETGLPEEGGGRKRPARQKKDVKSWEQTEGFAENKGLRGFQG